MEERYDTHIKYWGKNTFKKMKNNTGRVDYV